MVAVKFNSVPFVTGPKPATIEEYQLENLTSMEGVTLAFARENAAPLIKALLNTCPISSQRKNVYVDIRIQHLKKGEMPHKPGWHCDTTLSPTYTGSPDIHHLFVTGQAALTPFIGEEITLNYETHMLPPEALVKLQEELNLKYPEPKIIYAPSNTWITYGPLSFHRVKAADYEETRLLIRVRETDLENQNTGLILEEGKESSIAEILKSKEEPSKSSKKLAIRSFILWLFNSMPELEEFNFYKKILKKSFLQHPPPYCLSWYGELYKELSLDKMWFSSTLLKNALAEASGARKAKIMASEVPGPFLDDAILFMDHAKDELKHAFYFRKLFKNYFSTLVQVDSILLRQIDESIENTRKFIKQENKKHPLSSISYIDKIIQINIGEIRSLVQALLLKSVVLAMLPEDSDAVNLILNTLITDEMLHIYYTAKLIERLSGKHKETEIKEIFLKRVQDLNDETLKETGGNAEGYYITRLNKSIIRLDKKNLENEKAILKTAV